MKNTPEKKQTNQLINTKKADPNKIYGDTYPTFHPSEKQITRATSRQPREPLLTSCCVGNDTNDVHPHARSSNKEGYQITGQPREPICTII